MRPSTGILVCCVVGLLPGCYSYSIVPVETVAPGTSVRASITAAEADRLRETLGRDKRVLVGTVVGAEPGSIMLSVPTSGGAAIGRASRLRQRIAVPRDEILALEVRRLDRLRTAGLFAAGAVIGGILVVSAFGGEEDTAGRPDEGGTDAVRVPVVQLRWW